MEDVYTIRVKTKPDTRNLYPSERRYSASTVSGLAWVHIALAATSFLLACLALINPTLNYTAKNATTTFNESDTQSNDTEILEESNSNYILVLAPCLITIFGLAAGVAAILASVRWYIDRNITWLFVISCLSTAISFSSFVMIAVWFINTADGDLSEFYKDKVPFKDIIVIKHTNVVDRNGSHMTVALNPNEEETSTLFTKRVISINILIAAFLEVLWSILSVKISYKGMKNNYKDEGSERRGNCISVVTTIKGNDPKNLPRNGKLLQPKPDLIEHYPSKKIKRMFLAQNDDGYYLKNENGKTKNTETSSEFYKERMINFLNKCASMEGVSNPERTPSVQSESVLNPIPEIAIANVEINLERTPQGHRITPISWGDSPDHTIYNQNNINFEKIFKFLDKESEKRDADAASENVQNN